MISFTVIRAPRKWRVEIRDEFAEREVTLPTGHTIPLDMIGTLWFTPSGNPEGVAVTG